MVTINKIVEFLDTTAELTPEDVTKLESLLDQVDLSENYGAADSNISIKEWLALRDTPEFQGFLDQTFGRYNEDAQTSFTTRLNALFRPAPKTQSQVASSHAKIPTEVTIYPPPQDSGQLSPDIPLHLVDLDRQSLNQYLDGQVDLLRNDNIPIADRAEQGHFLVEQLKSEGLYLEAASLYEELAFLFARSGDEQAEQTLQTEANYWRHFDTYQDPFVASVEALKEDLSVSLQTNQFYPSQKITEAQLALLNHDVVTAKKSLEDLGWWILQNTPGYESGNNFDTLSVTTTLGPWSDPASTSISDFLKPYWTQAKQMYDGALVQEDRQTTLELLMLEAKEDQFNLSDEMQHQVHTAELESSSGFFDKYISYPFQSAVGTLNAEGYFLKKYEGRMAFRYLLQTILVSGKASSLDEAVKVALESNDPQVKENYEFWQSWRDAFKQYGVGFTVTYDRNIRESKIYGRQELDGYWRDQITQAKNNNNYDKVLMFYGTILEADLVKAQTQIPYDQVLLIKAAAEQKASERKQSIWEPIIAQLKRQYPDKSDDELNLLAEKAFVSVVEQYQQEQLQDAALSLLEKRGVFTDGPFSKELRQEVLDDYQNAVGQKKEIEFEQKLTTMILIQVPLIMAGGWVAGIARAGTATLLARGTVAVVGSEEAAAGVMATRAYTATRAVLGTTVAGTTFHTTESFLSSPIQGSAAFDNYARGCALSTGMFAALDLYKVGYGAVANPWFQQRYATGEAQLQNGMARLTLTPGAEAMRSAGEIGGESLVMSGYGYFEEAVNGGPGTLEDHSFGDRYADAVITVLALRGGQKLAEFTLSKLKSNLKPGDNLNNADVVLRLADANIFLLSPKDFRDLAIRMGFPEMADVPALTDTQTGFVFINRGRIPAENPRASIDFLIEHEEVHRRLQVTDFNAVLSQPKWAEVKQKYLDEIYNPNGGTKQLNDSEILEECVAHYRAWSRLGTTLSPQEAALKAEFGALLEGTGLAGHPIFGDLQAVPVVQKERETSLAAAWSAKTVTTKPVYEHSLPEETLEAIRNHPIYRRIQGMTKKPSVIYIDPCVSLNQPIENGQVGESIQSHFVQKIIREILPDVEFKPFPRDTSSLDESAIRIKILDLGERRIIDTTNILNMPDLKAANPGPTVGNSREYFRIDESAKVVHVYTKYYSGADKRYGVPELPTETKIVTQLLNSSNPPDVIILSAGGGGKSFEDLSTISPTPNVITLSNLQSGAASLSNKAPNIVLNDTTGMMPYIHAASNQAIIVGPINLFESLSVGTPTIYFDSQTVITSGGYDPATFANMRGIATQTNGAIPISSLDQLPSAMAKSTTIGQIVPPHLVKTDGKTQFEHLLDNLEQVIFGP